MKISARTTVSLLLALSVSLFVVPQAAQGQATVTCSEEARNIVVPGLDVEADCECDGVNIDCDVTGLCDPCDLAQAAFAGVTVTDCRESEPMTKPQSLL